MPVRLISKLILILAIAAGFSAPFKEATSPAAKITIHDFFRLFVELSEPEGYFDSDNLVSNEGAYLKIVPELKRQGASGGAYLGVGPDQNYSYIAHLKPEVAFIIDIRRLNALEHFYFKALFQLSSNRLQYLERLFGRKVRNPAGSPESYGISELLQMIDASPTDPSFSEKRLAEALETIQSWGSGLPSRDYESIRFVAREFIRRGPDLRFTSYNRPPQARHPSYRQLLQETDSEGVQANYLAGEKDFLLIKQMHRENRIVPFVGDLAGPEALLRVAQELKRRNVVMTCFYVSNIEFYLFRDLRWPAYIRNLSSLPHSENTILIRSYPSFLQADAIRRPGYYMDTIFQPLQEFLTNEAAGKNSTYGEMVLGTRPR